MKPSAIRFLLEATRIGGCLIAGLVLISNSARATSVILPQFPELVSNSEYVVRAVVTSVSSELRSNRALLLSEQDVAKPMTRSLTPAALGTAPAMSPADFSAWIRAVPQTNHLPHLAN